MHARDDRNNIQFLVAYIFLSEKIVRLLFSNAMKNEKLCGFFSAMQWCKHPKLRAGRKQLPAAAAASGPT
jgi:hypothetical protein